MGFRFRKSIKIAPGVKLNFNKKSSGVTFGGKGFHYTINSKGKRTVSAGIPGTGLSYSESIDGKASETESSYKNNVSENRGKKNMKKKSSKKGCLPVLIIGAVLACVVGACGGNGDDIAETTTEIMNVIETVITTEYTTVPTLLTTESSTTEISTTEKETTTEKKTTTTKAPTTTEKETTTEKKTTTTTKAPTTTKKETTTEKKTTTTTKKATTTEKKTTTTTKKATTTEKKTTTTTKKATTTTKKVTTTKKPTTTQIVTTTKKSTTVYNGSETGEMVWIPESGKKYHNDPSCSNMNNPSKVTVSRAESLGYTPCKKCY